MEEIFDCFPRLGKTHDIPTAKIQGKRIIFFKSSRFLLTIWYNIERFDVHMFQLQS